MKTIIFIGAPGSGKGSRIKECVKNADYTQISSGDLLRNAGFDLSSGQFVKDSIVVSIVKDAMKKAKGNIILDGFPRNISQAKELEKQGVKVDKIIHIKISPEEAVKRALNRLTCPNCNATYSKTGYNPPKKEGICDLCGEKLTQRSDDTNEGIIRERIKIYEEKTFPVIEFYKSKGIKIDVLDTAVDPNSKVLTMI